MCQKSTGSAAAVLAWISRDHLSWLGEAPAEFRSSPIATRLFCGRCGTSVALAYDRSPEIALHIAMLEDRGELPPHHHYGIESRLKWFDAGRGLEEKATQERWDPAGRSGGSTVPKNQ
jgi:hypothetical protein